jgi:hypothetical protein
MQGVGALALARMQIQAALYPVNERFACETNISKM